MKEFTASVLIHKPPAEVMDMFSDEEKAPLWNVLIEAMKLVRGERCQVGAVYLQKVMFMGRRFEQLLVQTDRTPYTRVFKTEKPFPQEYAFSFEPVPEGTRAAVAVRYDPQGFLRLAAPLIDATSRRNWQASLENLKTLVETPVPTTV